MNPEAMFYCGRCDDLHDGPDDCGPGARVVRRRPRRPTGELAEMLAYVGVTVCAAILVFIVLVLLVMP